MSLNLKNTPNSCAEYKAGDTIVRQGEKGKKAYIIDRGRVEIFVERPDGGTQHLGTRGAGAIIGEMAIIDDAPRTATIKAIEDCALIEITREDFIHRLSTADPVMQMFMQVILTRYRDMLTRSEILTTSQSWPPAEEVEKSFAAGNEAVEAIKIAHGFREALAKDELQLYYQPIIDVQTKAVTGFEALMRWNHPERGFISPGVFIPVAEKTGLIITASNWAMREACHALKRIESASGIRNLGMSINFSNTDFASENFVDTVYEILSETDVPAKQLTLEITERILMQQPETARETLNMCRKAGMTIAIDDFGTGYSSLSYLHYFPIDILKIDRAFVSDMGKEKGSHELVRSIVGLGKNMNMTIVAEGVEEQEERDMLADMDCDRIQGYFYAKPMPEDEVVNFLKNWK